MILETVTGKTIDPSNIDTTQIDIEDIAWSLSRISRFAGHTVTAIPYNVAQHSCFVADLIYENRHDNLLAMYGLLHDAAECYIGDIPSPIKKIPALKAVIDPIEDQILKEVFLKYVGSVPTENEWNMVKHFDKKAQFTEAYQFMNSRGTQWAGRENYDISLTQLQKFPEPIDSLTSYRVFMEKYEYYKTT